ncbi:MAG: hypothetical protein HY855_02900 [Burkholderiales bacterium]|nr:hypothetical protein [Burkholderiales bacterium]
MGAQIDLSKAWLSRTYGDITAVFSWFNDQRALFLIPTLRARAPWFIVLEPVAHEWNDQDRDNFVPQLTGGQRRRLERLPKPVRDAFLADLQRSGLKLRATQACDVLGIEPSDMNVHRIISIVNDALPDLVRMPSAPAKEFRPGTFGHLELRADGQLMGGEEIRLEREGVAYG